MWLLITRLPSFWVSLTPVADKLSCCSSINNLFFVLACLIVLITLPLSQLLSRLILVSYKHDCTAQTMKDYRSSNIDIIIKLVNTYKKFILFSKYGTVFILGLKYIQFIFPIPNAVIPLPTKIIHTNYNCLWRVALFSTILITSCNYLMQLPIVCQ